MDKHDIIAIGASAGALEALRRVLRPLPKDIPAALFCVVHLASRKSLLAEILNAESRVPVRFAENKDPVRSGSMLVAPPDRHLILKPDGARLSRGPRENLWRPSVDVLFRSAATAFGPRVIGVVLSGALDDGTSGLRAIVECGGTPVVQDPAEAAYPEMPASAIRNVPESRVLKLDEIGPELLRLTQQPVSGKGICPEDVLIEARIAEGAEQPAEAALRLGRPSLQICPECGGPLTARQDGGLRFRCRVGHAYTDEALDEASRRQTEASLWTAVRLFQQRANLERAREQEEREAGRHQSARQYKERASESEQHAQVLREMLAGRVE